MEGGDSPFDTHGSSDKTHSQTQSQREKRILPKEQKSRRDHPFYVLDLANKVNDDAHPAVQY